MTVNEKIKQLRKLMAENGFDAYIIPSTDPHLSEYVPKRWTSRAWISGFDGSAGTIVITKDSAGLWTDSRYFLQANEQLNGTEIKLQKLNTPGFSDYPEWLSDNLPEGSTVAFDGGVFALNISKKLVSTFELKKLKINSKHDLIDKIWKDRPEIPKNKIFLHEEKYAGKNLKDKINEVRDGLKKANADATLICTLDDIAWIFNLRGNDVDFNPVAVAYTIITHENAELFILKEKLDDKLIKHFESNGVTISDYHAVDERVAALKGNVLIDPARTIKSLYDKLGSDTKVIEKMNISTLLKSKKNIVEIEGMKAALRRDAIALTEFSMWLESKMEANDTVTETQVMDKLQECRSKIELYFGESFNTISGYGAHGAIVHYSATKDSEFEIGKDTFFLLDSGGQYFDGTTDITRMFHFGQPTPQEKDDYTRVLKGHIDLALQKFPAGTRGSQLDILARKHLWDVNLQYGHGTGHGIGCFLNVHEGPQNIRMDENPTVLETGMITSNEPGVYRSNMYGIRIENLILAVDDLETDFGKFLRFDTLTLFPIETKCIEPSLMTAEEKQWLNNYHQRVYDEVSPLLSEEQVKWLKSKCKAI